ncbi:unnamed protein product [Rhodiola kirilowii]
MTTKGEGYNAENVKVNTFEQNVSIRRRRRMPMPSTGVTVNLKGKPTILLHYLAVSTQQKTKVAEKRKRHHLKITVCILTAVTMKKLLMRRLPTTIKSYTRSGWQKSSKTNSFRSLWKIWKRRSGQRVLDES